MTRTEHVEWAKQRAREYLDRDEWQQAFASMVSDLAKHPDTAKYVGLELGMLQVLSGFIKDTPSMRTFIEGFN